MILMSGFSYWYMVTHPMDFTMYNASSVEYRKGRVVEVTIDQTIAAADHRRLGQQHLKVKLDSGQEVQVLNNRSTSYHIDTQVGTEIIVRLDNPQSTKPLAFVYGYNREIGIWMIMMIFVGLIALVGRRKGLFSVVGLLFSLYFMITFLLHFLFQGGNPILGAMITVVACSFVSLSLLNGLTKKTRIAFLSTLVGVIVSIGIYYLLTGLLKIDGYGLEEVEELLFVTDIKGLQIKELLFVGVIIASLGAVMDMTMSITTSLYEIQRAKPTITKPDLIKAGFELGKDMTGTMTETLVFAFIGTALVTLLLLPVAGVKMIQIINSNYIAIQLIYAITGAIGVILSVPITTIVYVLDRSGSRNQNKLSSI